MRKLTLKRETVAELTSTELGSVVGGVTDKYCVSRLLSCECSQIDDCLTWHCPLTSRC